MLLALRESTLGFGSRDRRHIWKLLEKAMECIMIVDDYGG